MRVRIKQDPRYHERFWIQYKNWYCPFWRTFDKGYYEKEAMEVAQRLQEPKIIELKQVHYY